MSSALLSALVALLGLAQLAPAADSPPPLGSLHFEPSSSHPFGWRGDGSGCFRAARPPLEWSATKNVRWSAPVGRGYSSPILTDKCVLIVTEPNLLTCLRRADGGVLWKLALTGASFLDEKSRSFIEAYEPPKDGAGMAAATPVTDGESVFTLLANGLVCSVRLDGKLRWAACLQAEQSTGYGRSSSPLLIAGKLILHVTNLYALDPATGRQLWVNTDAASSYGTPLHVRSNGADVVVTSLGDVVSAADGKSLNTGIGHTAQSSPIQSPEGLVCFGDSEVSVLRLGPAFKEQEIWSASLPGEVFGSPVWCDETFFIATGGGALFTFPSGSRGAQNPISNGEELFAGKNPSGPLLFSSPTLAGKYLFCVSDTGETAVLEATPQASLLHRNKLPEGSRSSPVFSGSYLFLHAGERLYCISDPAPSDQAAVPPR